MVHSYMTITVNNPLRSVTVLHFISHMVCCKNLVKSDFCPEININRFLGFWVTNWVCGHTICNKCTNRNCHFIWKSVHCMEISSSCSRCLWATNVVIRSIILFFFFNFHWDFHHYPGNGIKDFILNSSMHLWLLPEILLSLQQRLRNKIWEMKAIHVI